MRGGDAFTFGIEGDAGNGGGVWEGANFFAFGVEDGQIFAGAAGQQAVFSDARRRLRGRPISFRNRRFAKPPQA